MSSHVHGEIDFWGAVEGLLPHQRAFLQSDKRNVALVGGVGGGKSIALCIAALLNMAQDPGGFSLIGRLHMPSLQNTTMKTFLELVPDEWGEWKPSEKRFVAANGHEVVFLHLDITDPKVAGHIKSMNLSACFVDEATEISEDTYYLLLSRLRRKGAPRHIMRLASNPAGQDWVWRHYFDPHRKARLKHYNEGIHMSTFDNTHLSKDYIDSLVATYPEDWAQRHLYGSFSDFSDLIFKEFSERSHVWPAMVPQDIFGGLPYPPYEWPVICGIDIGSDVDPWAIVFISVEPSTGRLFQYDEIYGNNMLIERIAAGMGDRLFNRPRADIAYDYSNRQCALELAEYGIHGQSAIKEVQPGLFKMCQYMHIDPRLIHPFVPDQVEGSPRYFVASHCRNTIREFTSYKWAKDRSGNPTGLPAHEHSHSPDGARYAVHTFRPLPEQPRIPEKWENPELDELSRQYWRDVAKHSRETERERAPGLLRFRRPAKTNFRRPAVLRSVLKSTGRSPSL